MNFHSPAFSWASIPAFLWAVAIPCILMGKVCLLTCISMGKVCKCTVAVDQISVHICELIQISVKTKVVISVSAVQAKPL